MTVIIRNHLGEASRRGYVAAYRLLGNRADSQEACQEAAAKALASAGSYDPARPFYPWFYRILKNLCLDRLRQRSKYPTATEAPELASANASAETQLVTHERHKAVLAGIDTLAETHREVLELRHFQDLSYEEMATILDCPTGTVMSRLYRARKALRETLLDTPAFQAASDDQEDNHDHRA